MIKNRLFVFLGLIILSSCQYKSAKIDQGNRVDTLLSKKIRLPAELLELQGERFLKIDTFVNEIKGKNMMILIVDGTCIKCVINHLNVLDSIFHSIIPNTECQVVFVLNVSQRDSAFFMNDLRPEIRASGKLLWDSHYYFELYNALLTPDKNLRTFMTNKDGKIVYYGNPIIDPSVIHGYKRALCTLN
ncbi:hypothetical protein DMA11_23790 [Marinilabiliaceae bacterium JC017]|nr:hypothetical protein DMA11_23790 [Marinilabiliaceae bacterium JC017]